MLSRRELFALGIGVPAYTAAVPGETHQASGCKAGEMTSDSARLWLRRTASSQRLANGIVRRGHAREAKLLPPDARIDTLEGSAAGAAGYLRVVYSGSRNRAPRIRLWRGVGRARRGDARPGQAAP